ncbi:LOW QUALITY PROTEIN: SCO-spondin [Leucoraja erinacea]|uniref:LOW QUALITY PROTEIN: SCO-spondin n=1 Tax=Leucoraja erinaceus TaxID=7782 RepID=UPI002454FEF4|nr:LOW QUALITY PROTEIN: SCO-spondin [Leucoraja erinacea]
MESCCGDQQGRSWSNRAGVCLPCPPLTSTDIRGQGSVVRFRVPRAASTPLPLGSILLGSGQVWPLGPTMLVPGRDRPLGPTMLVSGRDWPRAACVTWSGVHYRTFDGRHFTFGGSCTYTLAAGLDGTWSVHLSTPPCTRSVRTECPKALRAMFGLNLVLIENGTVVINGAVLSPGQSHPHSDDLTTAAGSITPVAAAFGNSWRVAQSEPEDCEEASEPGPGCGGAADPRLPPLAHSLCPRILAPPFTQCHAQVWPDSYLEACWSAFCRGEGSVDGRLRSVCQTFASYARECGRHQIYPQWRSPAFCDQRCAGGMVYTDCVSSCPATCETLESVPPGCREECVGGCECPPGLYRQVDRCVTIDECPCFHRGQWYPPGQALPSRCNRCMCTRGRWACTRERCAAECAVLGDHHYVTFDHTRYSMQGACEYTLVEDYVDGKLLISGQYGDCGRRTGGCLRTLTIIVYRTVVRGLCGTYSWNRHDDFLTPLGDVETAPSAFVHKFASPPGCPPADPLTPDPCDTYAQRREFAQETCRVLRSATFQPCHDRVDLDPYLQLCMVEVCGCMGAADCRCGAVAAYARSCAQEGGQVTWRSATFCPVHCTGGAVYSDCGPACGDSCWHQRMGLSCDGAAVCVPGCSCPPGLLRDDGGQCVPPSLCPCPLHGTLHPPGSTETRGCNTCICTSGAWNCTEQTCPEAVSCPHNLIYTPHACPHTCDTLHDNRTCPDSFEGCGCPEDLVLLGDRCVSPADCPCRHNGRLYQRGQSVHKDCNTCVCVGHVWRCGREACAGRCLATGDPHYVTFDGRAFSFQGDCGYLLVQDVAAGLAVSAQNMPCGTGHVSCTKAVTITLGSTSIHLMRGRAVTVNGVAVKVPKDYVGSGLSLRVAGIFVAVISRLGLTVLWDGGTRVYVRLEPRYRGRVSGLCGNFDGDTENDFTARQGMVEATPERFANSWRLSPSCPELSEDDVPQPCSENPHRVTWARKRCGVISQHVFQACHTEVPPQPFYQWCVYDACGCDSGGDCECLCTAIATYAEECNERGVYVRWRSQDLCRTHAVREGGRVYEACGPPCQPSCATRTAPPDPHCHSLPCVEGASARGLCRGLCVPPSNCPCYWGETAYPQGTAISQDCRNCTCWAGEWECEGGQCGEPGVCVDGEFRCASGRCVPRAWLCDNEDDCGDGSDEACVSSCEPGHFRCTSGQCVGPRERCDGWPDCPDRSDEADCPSGACADQEFRCGTGQCVPILRRCDGHSDCADQSDEAGCRSLCTPVEFQCWTGMCVPYGLRCDGRDDCGDFSDERGCVCGPGQFQCPEERCLPNELLCDGTDHCTDGLDELLCPTAVPVRCGVEAMACGDGQCVPRARLCDGVIDCAQGEDENPANCPVTSSAPTLPGTSTAGPSITGPSAGPPMSAGPSCSHYEFRCGSGECMPRGWLCDRELDCGDGSDEHACNWTCAVGEVQCAGSSLCIQHRQLRDGIPQCPEWWDEHVDTWGSERLPPCPGSFLCTDGVCLDSSRLCDGVADCPLTEDELDCELVVPTAPVPGGNETTKTCPMFPCANNNCITFLQVCDGINDCSDGSAESRGFPSDEMSCGMWSPWGSWSDCSQTCEAGVQSRKRLCSSPSQDVLRQCRGLKQQTQQCFSRACPEDGRWSEWTEWSNCTQDCEGMVVRERTCLGPRNGGKTCLELPHPPVTLDITPCRSDDCPDPHPCPGHLVWWDCAPCPLTCAQLAAEDSCPQDATCNPGGCWCPEGEVADSGADVCAFAPVSVPGRGGAEYWPGQTVKVDCQLWSCWGGQLGECQPNPRCSVDCGWSGWSPWGQCLGPCGVQSVQWSFRSPNNPKAQGQGSRCRGIYRKARRCQTPPCQDCSSQGKNVHCGGALEAGSSVRCVSAWSSREFTAPSIAPSLPSAVPRVRDWLKVRWRDAVTNGLLLHLLSIVYCVLCFPGAEEPTLPSTFPTRPGFPEVTGVTRAAPGQVLPPTAPPVGCRSGQFHCHNGQCVTAGAGGQLCDGTDDCGDASDELHCGVVSPVVPVAGDCVSGEFRCTARATCVPASRRCDGRSDCSDGSDEHGCGTSTAKTFSRHLSTREPNTSSGIISRPQPPGRCDQPLGLEDGRIRYQQLSASSSRESNPPDAGRLNIIPNILNLEPGWSPVDGDTAPYLQVDLLVPTFVSGGFVTHYSLASSYDGIHFANYTGSTDWARPPQVLRANSDANTPVRRDLQQLIFARYLRIIPLRHSHGIFLRTEILGCPWSESTHAATCLDQTHPGQTHPGQTHPGQTHPGQTHPGQTHPGSPSTHPGQTHPGQPHPGQTHPGPDSPRPNSPGLSLPSLGHVPYLGPMGQPMGTSGTSAAPGPLDGWSQGLGSGVRPATTAPRPLPPRGCVRGEFQCGSGECVGVSALCNQRADCRDASDEVGCGTVSPWTGVSSPPAVPTLLSGSPAPGPSSSPPLSPTRPSPLPGAGTETTTEGAHGGDGGVLPPFLRVLCVHGQFRCDHFECIDPERVCDGITDCADSTDEQHCGVSVSEPCVCVWAVSGPCLSRVSVSEQCVSHRGLPGVGVDGLEEGCLVSGWTDWSGCSHSCSLGLRFRQREVLRPAVGDGGCNLPLWDTHGCFTQACPVNGGWSSWSAWSVCDAACGGGVRTRHRQCVSPPPKNGGASCPGSWLSTQSCNRQLCPNATDCGQGMVRVTVEDCDRQALEPCTLTCDDQRPSTNCTSPCSPDCRSPHWSLPCSTLAPHLFLSGRSLGHTSPQWSHTGSHWATLPLSGSTLGHTGSHWPHTGSHWPITGPPGFHTGLPWPHTGPHCPSVVPHWATLVPHWATLGHTGPTLGHTGSHWPITGPTLGHTGPTLGHIGHTLGRTGPTLGHTESHWVTLSHTGSHWPHTVALGPHWLHTGSHLVALAPHWPHTGPHWPNTGPTLGHTESHWVTLGPTLSHWSHWPPHWAHTGHTGPHTGPHWPHTGSHLAPTLGPGPHTGPHWPHTGTTPLITLAPHWVTLAPHWSPPHLVTLASHWPITAPHWVILAHHWPHTGSTGPALGPTLVTLGHTGPTWGPTGPTLGHTDLTLAHHWPPTGSHWPPHWPHTGSHCPHTVATLPITLAPTLVHTGPTLAGHTGPTLAPHWVTLAPHLVRTGPTLGHTGPTLGCRCIGALVLQDGHCVNTTQCHCRHHTNTIHPGQAVIINNCSHCVCHLGRLTCDDSRCPTDCGWSAWSPWTRCYPACGAGDQERYRSPTNPTPANGGAPCVGDSVGLQSCYVSCGPVAGGWSSWSQWSQCSAPCNSGVQTRNRSCRRMETGDGATGCVGPHVQTRDCNTQPCDKRCPAEMQYLEVGECQAAGGACPRACQDLSADVQCTTRCYDGCYCDQGLLLLNGSCVPLHNCSCYHQGQWLQPGESLRRDPCNNCTCVSGELVCGDELCAVTDCSSIDGAVYDLCGPPCPRSCSDLTHCTWSCEPGCYCTDGQVLTENGTSCVDRQDCPCRDPVTGERYSAGEVIPRDDGCNNCSCVEGQLTCTRLPCAVQGHWCPWSAWTPCSRTCGTESTTRYRACACPEPRDNGTECPGAQRGHGNTGLQVAVERCPSLSFCPGTWHTHTGHGHGTRDMDMAHGHSTRHTDTAHRTRTQHTGHRHSTRDMAHGHSTRHIHTGHGTWDTAHGTRHMDTDTAHGTRTQTQHTGHGHSTRDMNMGHGHGTWDMAHGTRHTDTDMAHRDTVDGGWSRWSAWSECAGCGAVSARSRRCSSPPPRFSGAQCGGEAEQRQACHNSTAPCTDCAGDQVLLPCGRRCPRSCDDLSLDVLCLDDGALTSDADAGCQPACACPADLLLQNGTCVPPGECGCKSRDRSVSGSWSLYQGAGDWVYTAAGESRETECSNCTCVSGLLDCTPHASCRRDGGWSPWAPWTACSETCGGGSQHRVRECSSPRPQNGGSLCPGPATQSQACNTEHCGDWGPWTEWSSCSSTCGPGLETRHRNCSWDVSQSCLGSDWESRHCNGSCGDGTAWSPWSPWSRCSVSCGGGEQVRTRTCHRPPCNGFPVQSTTCQTQVCLEVGCPSDRLYRECVGAEGCPYSCEHLRGQVDCFSDGCEEGCHCPVNMYLHNGTCVQECGCIVTEDIVQLFQNHSLTPSAAPTIMTDKGAVPQGEISPGVTLWHECSNCDYLKIFSKQSYEEKTKIIENGRPTPEHKEFQQRKGTKIIRTFKTAWYNRKEWPSCLGNPCPALTGLAVLPSIAQLSMFSSSTCSNGRLACSFSPCVLDGEFSDWSPWTSCSRTCGAIGQITRTRNCSNPAPTNGGRDCAGPRADVRFCQPAECEVPVPTMEASDGVPDAEGFSPWTAWTRCSRNCSDSVFPSLKNRTRSCHRMNCSGETVQERPCNLPQCTDVVECSGWNCSRNCSWNLWSEWSECSRGCGVGQQHRLRTYNAPWSSGHWCKEILTGNLEIRFCNIKACMVNGGWSSWSPWSTCDRACGGGRSLRIRSCTEPPPKNGGKNCAGERFEATLCNVQPCGTNQGADACPTGQEYVDCANRCPRACADFQSGIACSDTGQCEAGCRCPDGALLQDGACVAPWQCQCTDSLGNAWAPGSRQQVDCNNCTCAEGWITCSNLTCAAPDCAWSQWSTWSSCSLSCGTGVRSRFRSPTSQSPDRKCGQHQAETKPCDQGPCPALCLHEEQEMQVGESWFVGECRQCLCTPEGIYCQPLECRVDGGWTPWSPWSDCPVTCGWGMQTSTRACINPPPRNLGLDCEGLSFQTRNCSGTHCPDGESCHWSEWSACPTCGPGYRSRSCSDTGEERQEVEPCYNQPCAVDCELSLWSEWSACSCSSPVQHRYRLAHGPLFGGRPCRGREKESRVCHQMECADAKCDSPFEHRTCGHGCGHCSDLGQSHQCDLSEQKCVAGCYCPEGLWEQDHQCVPSSECECVHLHQSDGHKAPVPLRVPPGATVLIGCNVCLCKEGVIQCTNHSCTGEVEVSEWSDWTGCAPCVPRSALSQSSVAGWPRHRLITLNITQLPAAAQNLLREERFRVCLASASGQPVNGSRCNEHLVENRTCTNLTICSDECSWGPWDEWSPCREPCSGGYRIRQRSQAHPQDTENCQEPKFQSESCNTAMCPGELCEDREKEFVSCANPCPRTCTDLWDHVQCLQGLCKPGCRCPRGQLLQDSSCVLISECRCGLPSSNRTVEYQPGDRVVVPCGTCACVNGTFDCSDSRCAEQNSWSAWSQCSQSCGGGERIRSRSCGEPGTPCQGGSVQTAECNQVPCQGCPEKQVFSSCANICPRTCSDLRAEVECQQEACKPGCLCPHGQFLQGEVCVSPEDCHCSLLSSQTPRLGNISHHDYPPGAVIHDRCSVCVCQKGVFHCSKSDCEAPSSTSVPTSPLTLPDPLRMPPWRRPRPQPWAPSTQAPMAAGIDDPRLLLPHSPTLYTLPTPHLVGPFSETLPEEFSLLVLFLFSGAEWVSFGLLMLILEQSVPRVRFGMGGPMDSHSCERSCRDVHDVTVASCGSAGKDCVCDAGRYRNMSGFCVTAAYCECIVGDTIYPPGYEWADGCEQCRCLNGRKVCSAGCPPLYCLEGYVKVVDPGQCCPVCRKEVPDDSSTMCLRYTEMRNISKGHCRLENVLVNSCTGSCLSQVQVIPEEPYLQSQCECCSYRLHPDNPVQFINLQCENGDVESIVLPVIHSCECSSCQGGDFSRR